MSGDDRVVYFYGVVRGELSGPLPDVTPIDGDGTGEVYGIRYRGLTAVVSDARRDRYEVSRRNLLGHEAVVTCLMQRHDLLPARFGSIRPSARVLEELLVRHYESLCAQFERVAGRQELGLKVSWAQIQSVITEIVARDTRLRAARRWMANAAAPHSLRLEIGRRVERALDAARAAEAAEIVRVLAPLTADDGVRHNDHCGEAMILDAAFLVSRERITEFQAAVARYDQAMAERYRMRLTTPAAPYGFVTPLEATVPQRDRTRL
jgi:gas vesicle protein GvpL/GvpF